MTINNRTYDGDPLSVGMSGFNQFTTEQVEPKVPPAPALSPQDILDQIKYLKSVLNQPELDRALVILYAHVHDKENPHDTTLSQLTEQVIDVFYKSYKETGGTASLEAYIKSLFTAFKVATLEEMKTKLNKEYLVNIRGAIQYITEHAIDPEAHKELIDAIYPGEPLEATPSFAISGSLGVPSSLLTQDSNYETSQVQLRNLYQGTDRWLHDRSDIPYIWPSTFNGISYIEVYGQRNNDILHCTSFIPDSVAINLTRGYTRDTPIAEDSIRTLAEEEQSCRLVGKGDTKLILHQVKFENVAIAPNQSKTFSVYAKAGSCPYLSISYRDMTESQIVVYGIFDLVRGECFLANGLNRYRVEMIECANGWYRCCFTMYHNYGQNHDLVLTVFKDKIATESNFDKYMYFASSISEELMYLFGAQLETGINASPLIYTQGQSLTRNPERLKFEIPVEESKPKLTIVMTFDNPPTFLDKYLYCPLFTILNSDESVACTARIRAGRKLEILHYRKLTVNQVTTQMVVSQEIFDIPAEFTHFVHSFDTVGSLTKLNQNKATPEVFGSLADTGKYMLIGCDTDGNYFNGCISSFTLYPRLITEAQAEFLTGESS